MRYKDKIARAMAINAESIASANTAQLADVVHQPALNTTNANILANTNTLSSHTTSIATNTTAIANIGNATPKGTYATLVALQTAYPTGTTGIYVVVADGKWYYYTASTWTAGGVYQSTGMANNTVNGNIVNGDNPLVSTNLNMTFTPSRYAYYAGTASSTNSSIDCCYGEIAISNFTNLQVPTPLIMSSPETNAMVLMSSVSFGAGTVVKGFAYPSFTTSKTDVAPWCTFGVGYIVINAAALLAAYPTTTYIVVNFPLAGYYAQDATIVTAKQLNWLTLNAGNFSGLTTLTDITTLQASMLTLQPPNYNMFGELAYINNQKLCCITPATYTGLNLGSIPRKISCSFTFENNPYDYASTGTLILNPLGTQAILDITTNSVHFCFGRQYCALDLWINGTMVTIWNYTYVPACLKDATTVYTITLVFPTGNQYVTITTPDGVVTQINDVRIANVIGQFMICEHYCEGDRSTISLPQFTNLLAEDLSYNIIVQDNFNRLNGAIGNNSYGIPYSQIIY